MKGRKGKRITIPEMLLLIFLLGVVAIFIFPIIWMLAASFQGQGEIFKIPFDFFPVETASLANYEYAWRKGDMGMAFLNTTIATGSLLALHVLACSITGYVFAKFEFRFKKTFLMLIMITLMVPSELTYFPLYDIVKGLHLMNTTAGLIFPFIYGGFGIIFMMQFASYIPNEIMEAARIDGCGETRIFLTVALPMMKSAISGLTILGFTFIWSEFAWARAVVTKDTGKTLALALTHMAKGFDNYVNYAALTAAGILIMAPILIVFLLFQKNFIESVAGSGVKG